jgi:ketosteroid isomerase-like protein
MFPSKLNIRSLFFQVSLLVFVFSSNSSFGQEVNSKESTENTMTAIYNDVWLPFMESYRELNIEKFKSIQAIDLTRVSIDRNTIQTKSAYFAEIEGFFKQIQQSKREMNIRFSILTSATGNDKAYQTGYYSIGSRRSNSESFQPMGYGYFTVVLMKKEGKWKISVDADKQAVIDEAEFRKSDLIYELD